MQAQPHSPGFHDHIYSIAYDFNGIVSNLPLNRKYKIRQGTVKK